MHVTEEERAKADPEEVWWELLHEAMGLPPGHNWDQVSRVMNRVVRPLLADIDRAEQRLAEQPTRYEWAVRLEPDGYIQTRSSEYEARLIHTIHRKRDAHSTIMRRGVTIGEWEEVPE